MSHKIIMLNADQAADKVDQTAVWIVLFFAFAFMLFGFVGFNTTAAAAALVKPVNTIPAHLKL